MTKYAALLLCMLMVSGCVSVHAQMPEQTFIIADVSRNAGVSDMFSRLPLPGRFSYVQKFFAQEYPELSIQNRRIGDTADIGNMQLLNEYIAGNGSADIIGMQYPDLPALYEAGSIVDLLDHEAIIDALAEWPDITRLMGDGEHLYALPDSLQPVIFELLKPDVLEALNMPTIDWDAWQWDDLFGIGDVLLAYNAEHGTDYALLCSKLWNCSWLAQFVVNEGRQDAVGDVDRAELQNLLSRWKSAIDNGLVVNPYDFLKNPDLADTVLFKNCATPYGQLTRNAVYLPPVYREDILRTGIDAYAYFVPTSAPHPDAAVAFLACYASPEALAQSTSYWNNGIFPGEGASWNPTGNPSSPEEASPERLALWQEAIETGYLNMNLTSLTEAYACHEQYLDGEITLEACVDEIISAIKRQRIE